MATPKLPYFQVHLSTCLIGMFLGAVVVWANTCPPLTSLCWSMNPREEYGWPFTFLHNYPDIYGEDSTSGHEWIWYPHYLFFNAALALVFIFPIAYFAALISQGKLRLSRLSLTLGFFAIIALIYCNVISRTIGFGIAGPSISDPLTLQQTVIFGLGFPSTFFEYVENGSSSDSAWHYRALFFDLLLATSLVCLAILAPIRLSRTKRSQV